MPIIIKSKREGFRRCGIAHHVAEVTHPDGRFTPDEITRLQAEPMLTVKRVPIESIKDAIEIDTESLDAEIEAKVPAEKRAPKGKKGKS